MSLVTVIVAARDLVSLVPIALDSLLTQTEQRWHAMLVDDGSVDGTDAVLADYAARDSRFTVLRHEAAVGLGAARNAALDLVTTPYVAFLDGDDVLRPHALETMLGTLERSGSDLAVAGYVRLRLTDGAWQTGDMQPWVRASVSPAQTGITLAEHPAVVGNIVAWSKVSRTELWRNLRFPVGVRYEDQVVAQRLYTTARRIDLIDDALIEWRIRADGTSITQGESDPAVLADCLAQMSAGLDVLRGGSGFAARTTQIVRMDVPRLADAATTPETRRMLAAFTSTLEPTPDDLALRVQSPSRPDETALVGDVYDRVLGWR